MKKSLWLLVVALTVLSGCASKVENARKNIVSVSPGREWKISDEFKFLVLYGAEGEIRSDEKSNSSCLGREETYVWANIDSENMVVKEFLLFREIGLSGPECVFRPFASPDVMQKIPFCVGMAQAECVRGGESVECINFPKDVYSQLYLIELRGRLAFNFTYLVDVDSVPEDVDKEAFVRKRAYEVIGMKAPG